MNRNATQRFSHSWISRFLFFLLLILHYATLPLSAQEDPHQRLHAAADLALQGHYEGAIELARPTLGSTALSQTERGRGWTLLGLAYQYRGDFQKATTAYENALQILEGRGGSASDYASALASFGTLYRDMGQMDAARRMELRALRVNQQINDPAGIAAVSATLADIELGGKHIGRAQTWLDEATRESRLAPTLGDSFHASVASSQAWLEELKGHMQAAIAGHEMEIDYLTHAHGEETPQVGWAYMLLGKAYLENGNVNDALTSMCKGRVLLLQTLGPNNLRYLVAQLEYAQALKSAGMKANAARTKLDAESQLKSIYKEQCSQCRITVMALR